MGTVWVCPDGFCLWCLAPLTHRLFKIVPLLQSECVSLGNDGDDVDHLTETPHELHIQGPKTER